MIPAFLYHQTFKNEADREMAKRISAIGMEAFRTEAVYGPAGGSDDTITWLQATTNNGLWDIDFYWLTNRNSDGVLVHNERKLEGIHFLDALRFCAEYEASRRDRGIADCPVDHITHYTQAAEKSLVPLDAHKLPLLAYGGIIRSSGDYYDKNALEIAKKTQELNLTVAPPAANNYSSAILKTVINQSLKNVEAPEKPQLTVNSKALVKKNLSVIAKKVSFITSLNKDITNTYSSFNKKLKIAQHNLDILKNSVDELAEHLLEITRTSKEINNYANKCSLSFSSSQISGGLYQWNARPADPNWNSLIPFNPTRHPRSFFYCYKPDKRMDGLNAWKSGQPKYLWKRKKLQKLGISKTKALAPQKSTALFSHAFVFLYNVLYAWENLGRRINRPWRT